MGAVVGNDAQLYTQTEGLPEGLVLFPILLLDAQQLGLDLFLQIVGHYLELAGMLQHLTADVEREVGAVYHAPDKAEVVGHQIGALVHDHNA